MAHLEGGCLCGSVRYRGEAEPAFIGVCHCTDCQRFTGSAFSTVIGVPTQALQVSGPLKTYTKAGDSGQPIHRRFCAQCGSGVLDEADAMPGLTMLSAGTLDDRSWVRPRAEIYCASAQSWVKLDGGLARFDKAPPQ